MFSVLFVCCASDDIFPSIGTNLANPVSVAVDSAANRAYVVSSNNKVYYDTGSLQVLNIATPASPTRVGTAEIPNFSGQVYLDAVNGYLYASNRLSTDNEDSADSLLRININEASGSFLAVETYTAGSNPFGVAYSAATASVYVSTNESKLDYFPTAAPARSSITLAPISISDGTTLSSANPYEVAIIGQQAFVTRSSGGVLVVDINENNIDYYISDIDSPRGIATDGVNIYVVSGSMDSGSPGVYVINPVTLTAVAGNSTATLIDKDTAGILTASITVGSNPQEVLAATNYIFVSNMSDDTVTAVNIPAYTVAGTITVGDEPFGLGLYSPGGVDSHVFVTNYGGNSVSIISIASLAVAATF